MKKLKIFYLAALAVTIMYTTGCKSVQDMVNRASEVTWNVAPGVLEMHGEQVQITITGKIPPKFFHKKGILVVSPVLKYGKSEKLFDQKTFQGEAVQDNNPIINFAAGGQISFSTTIPYTDEMQISELELRLTAKDNKGVKYDMPSIKLADGVIITPRLVKNGLGVDNEGFNNAGQYGLTSSEGVKLPGTVVSTLKADINYDLQKYDIKKTELSQEDITKLLNEIKANVSTNLKGINISSYASPEGELDLNTGLSTNRGKAADKFLKDDFKKAKVKIDPAMLTASTTPEDWDGFKAELANSNLKDKGLILNVLSMYTDPVVREREIKNLSEAYEELKTTVLPALRRSVFEARFETGTRTDAQILELMKSDPKQLTNNEMLHAGAISQNLNDKIEMYKITTQYFANDWRAYNGMGLAYMNLNKLTEAKESFEKAKSLDNNEKVNNNLGVVYFALGENDKAGQFFNSAGTVEAKYNVGVIEIMKGNYKAALSSFGNSCTFNAALAKILTQDYSGALSTINCMPNKDNAYAFYLKAIVGARTGDEKAVLENIKEAVKKDAKIKDYAKTDREFVKFMQNDTFLSLVR